MLWTHRASQQGPQPSVLCDSRRSCWKRIASLTRASRLNWSRLAPFAQASLWHPATKRATERASRHNRTWTQGFRTDEPWASRRRGITERASRHNRPQSAAFGRQSRALRRGGHHAHTPFHWPVSLCRFLLSCRFSLLFFRTTCSLDSFAASLSFPSRALADLNY